MIQDGTSRTSSPDPQGKKSTSPTFPSFIHNQAHKPSPPLKFAAEFDVVFASKSQFAVLANAEYRQCRWYVANIVAVAHVHIDNARGDQDPATGVHAEGTDVKALRVFVLD